MDREQLRTAASRVSGLTENNLNRISETTAQESKQDSGTAETPNLLVRGINSGSLAAINQAEGATLPMISSVMYSRNPTLNNGLILT